VDNLIEECDYEDVPTLDILRVFPSLRVAAVARGAHEVVLARLRNSACYRRSAGLIGAQITQAGGKHENR